MNMNSDRIVAIAAAVIALASLVVSVVTVRQTRKHNRLSVKPSVSVLNQFDDPDGPDWGWILFNKGIGPAFIRGLTIVVDGKPIIASRQYDAWTNVTEQLGITGDVATRSFGDGEAVSAGEKIPLLVANSKDQTQRARLRSVIGRLQVTIVYTSIYDEVFTNTTSGQP